MTAFTKTPQITFRRALTRPQPGLFDASGLASRMRASPLFAIGPSEPGPALRRGALLAVPIACALLLELGLGAPTQGAIGVGASICGFAAMDAPARSRVGWQAATAVAIGLAAALGVYVVLLTATVDESAVDAAGRRGLGLAIVFLAFVIWGNRDEPLVRRSPTR